MGDQMIVNAQRNLGGGFMKGLVLRIGPQWRRNVIK